MVENNPRILVIGLDKNPTDLIKRIIGKNIEPLNDTKEYPWQIKNKYYTANVHLLGFELKWDDVNEHSIYDNVEAMVVFFNSQHENAVNGLINLETYLEHYDVEVKLIVCDKFSQNAAEHNKVTDWCLLNNFQYIDLEYDEDAVDDDTDTDQGGYITDTYGIDRIIEDLQVHIWSNAKMIGKNTSTHQDDEFGEEELDEFCELYSQLSAIAGGINSLPRDQRLQSAEQVVKQFWSAISGGDEEFSDDDLDLGVQST